MIFVRLVKDAATRAADLVMAGVYAQTSVNGVCPHLVLKSDLMLFAVKHETSSESLRL